MNDQNAETHLLRIAVAQEKRNALLEESNKLQRESLGLYKTSAADLAEVATSDDRVMALAEMTDARINCLKDGIEAILREIADILKHDSRKPASGMLLGDMIDDLFVHRESDDDQPA